MRITVCIPATRAVTLPAAIDSLMDQTYEDWTLIVVAQGADISVPEASRRAAATSDRVRLVSIPHRGLSRARNAALEHADSEVIAMMDDDCEAAPDWLATLANCFQEDERVGLVGGALVAPIASRFLTRCPALDPADATYQPTPGALPPAGWDWIGGNFALRRSAADRVGPFDENLGGGATFMAGEDTDYKLRMEHLQIRMRSTPKAVVRHTWGSRHGLRALFRYQRSYAMGNGALAAKLTLAGDPRGREWVSRTRTECMQDLRNPLRMHRFPEPLLRWNYYRSAYATCLRDYDLDARGMLRKRQAPFEQHGYSASVVADIGLRNGAPDSESEATF